MRDRQRAMLGLTFIAAIALSGCAATPSSEPSPAAVASSDTPVPTGAPATWQLTDDSRVTPDSMAFEVQVTRLDCANGVTGEMLSPVITYEAEQVTVRIDAKPNRLEAADCQGNDAIPVTVTLSEPIGQRTLVDGACVSTEARTTAECVASERASFR
ncbi:hypothetical protein HCX50_09050 [Microbacterium oxydans]|uniref:hypothetical protein n=1 Tax=Microbacterium sp. B19(2022) TaxID=2914045 RepID=UPI0014314E6C|nr:hypothetical protein [Microbacterium sp. B19(2022)]NJI59571.1 hypothetical protein [Microbacterium sp. B19(2022)]